MLSECKGGNKVAADLVHFSHPPCLHSKLFYTEGVCKCAFDLGLAYLNTSESYIRAELRTASPTPSIFHHPRVNKPHCSLKIS